MHASRSAGAALLLMTFVSPAQAQVSRPHPEREQRLELSIFGGGTAYSDFHRTIQPAPMGAAEPGTLAGRDGAPRVRRLTAETAPSFGVAVGYWVSPHWGIRLHGAVAPSRFHVISGSPRTDPRLEAAADSTVLAPLRIWTGDAAVLFKLPFELAGVMPYGMIGAGTLEYRARPGEHAQIPAEAAGGMGNGSHSQPVALLGGGASVPLAWRRALLSFELSTHLGRPATRASGGDAEGGGVGQPAPAMEDPPLTSQVRFLVGLTVPLFGNRMELGSTAPATAAPPPPVPPAPHSPAAVPPSGQDAGRPAFSERAPGAGSMTVRR